MAADPLPTHRKATLMIDENYHALLKAAAWQQTRCRPIARPPS
ncbi:hypothetical protein [Methylobacterium sp. Leaf91]|nr:hypothetical protein [Methylobacterium sp. Leaf91]